jgi:hypothetical protein
LHNGSLNITLKNVPENVHKSIKREAKGQGRSLNAFIIKALEAEASRAERQRNWPKIMKQMEKVWAALPPTEDSTALIREDRDQH